MAEPAKSLEAFTADLRRQAIALGIIQGLPLEAAQGVPVENYLQMASRIPEPLGDTRPGPQNWLPDVNAALKRPTHINDPQTYDMRSPVLGWQTPGINRYLQTQQFERDNGLNALPVDWPDILTSPR